MDTYFVHVQTLDYVSSSSAFAVDLAPHLWDEQSGVCLDRIEPGDRRLDLEFSAAADSESEARELIAGWLERFVPTATMWLSQTGARVDFAGDDVTADFHEAADIFAITVGGVVATA